jgi:hypothetical protein
MSLLQVAQENPIIVIKISHFHPPNEWDSKPSMARRGNGQCIGFYTRIDSSTKTKTLLLILQINTPAGPTVTLYHGEWYPEPKETRSLATPPAGPTPTQTRPAPRSGKFTLISRSMNRLPDSHLPLNKLQIWLH